MDSMISVVVPVYKVEQYLDRCVSSVLNQTYSEFELILVDDGSPDSCPQMCDEWARKDSRIKVIHQENRGCAWAIQQGIDLANGKYTTFVDSDDWLEPDYLQTLYDGGTEHNADVASCNFNRVYDERIVEYRFHPRIFYEKEIREVLLPEMADDRLTEMHCVRWSKIYKSQLAKEAIKLCDLSITVSEDFVFNFAVFGLSQKIVVLDTPPLYNYRIWATSVMGRSNLKEIMDRDAFYTNLKLIAEMYGCYHHNTELLRTRRYAEYICRRAILDKGRAERKKDIQTLLAVIDKELRYKVIKSFDALALRICLYLCYWGQIDLMLLLVDIVKMLKRIE